MKKHLLLGSLLLTLACGCAQNSSSTASTDNSQQPQQTTTAQGDSETQDAEKAAKLGARAIIMTAAGTPLKVASAVGTAAGVVKKKVEGEASPTPSPSATP